jgi:hypothetical protein
MSFWSSDVTFGDERIASTRFTDVSSPFTIGSKSSDAIGEINQWIPSDIKGAIFDWMD